MNIVAVRVRADGCKTLVPRKQTLYYVMGASDPLIVSITTPRARTPAPDLRHPCLIVCLTLPDFSYLSVALSRKYILR